MEPLQSLKSKDSDFDIQVNELEAPLKPKERHDAVVGKDELPGQALSRIKAELADSKATNIDISVVMSKESETYSYAGATLFKVSATFVIRYKDQTGEEKIRELKSNIYPMHTDFTKAMERCKIYFESICEVAQNEKPGVLTSISSSGDSKAGEIGKKLLNSRVVHFEDVEVPEEEEGSAAEGEAVQPKKTRMYCETETPGELEEVAVYDDQKHSYQLTEKGLERLRGDPGSAGINILQLNLREFIDLSAFVNPSKQAEKIHEAEAKFENLAREFHDSFPSDGKLTEHVLTGRIVDASNKKDPLRQMIEIRNQMHTLLEGIKKHYKSNNDSTIRLALKRKIELYEQIDKRINEDFFSKTPEEEARPANEQKEKIEEVKDDELEKIMERLQKLGE